MSRSSPYRHSRYDRERLLRSWPWPAAVLALCALACGEPTLGGSSVDALSVSDAGGSSALGDVIVSSVCQYRDDGVCDEPVNCPLGSDELDCASACDDETLLWRFGAACAYRSPPAVATRRPSQQPGTINLTGTFDRSVEVVLGDGDGTRARHYRLFVPPHYDPSQAWPLVIMMPGHRVDIYSLADYTQLEATAEANGFLLVYAEQEWRQSAFKWAWWTDWSWAAHPTSNPDVDFLSDLVDAVAEGWSVDRRRVYGVGHSRGGAMAYIAAFELAEVFAALCSQSGFIEFGFDAHVANYSGRKTPMMLVHGVRDDDVPVSRSDAMAEQLRALGWSDEELVYYRLANVAHRWQPWMNQQVWDFLSSHRLPEGAP